MNLFRSWFDLVLWCIPAYSCREFTSWLKTKLHNVLKLKCTTIHINWHKLIQNLSTDLLCNPNEISVTLFWLRK